MIIILLAALETWPDTPLACRMPASLRSISLWSLIQSRANNPADSFCSHQSGLDYSLSYAPTRRWNVCCIFPEDGRRCCIKSASAEVRWKWKGMSGKNGFPEGTGFSPPRDGTEIPHESPQLPKVPEEAYSSRDTQAMLWSLKVSLKRHTPPSPHRQAGRRGRWTMESGWNQLSSKQWHLFHSVCEYKEISWPYKCSFVTFCLELIRCNYSKF